MYDIPPTSRPTILVIDDSNFDQRIVIDALGRRDYRFNSARSGAQGYEMARIGTPDLILLDVRMPDMDGLALCRLLKASSATEHVPVIFLSGASSAHERIEGLMAGAVDFVVKPFLAAELSARIAIHLRLAGRPQPAAAPPGLPAPKAPQPIRMEREDATVSAAKHYILERLAELPPVSDIARQLGTYREKLQPLFRRQTGMTICAFVRHSRLERARELLSATHLDIHEVALMIGYNNSGNFATAFRAHTGLTPRHYRLRHGGGKREIES